MSAFPATSNCKLATLKGHRPLKSEVQVWRPAAVVTELNVLPQKRRAPGASAERGRWGAIGQKETNIHIGPGRGTRDQHRLPFLIEVSSVSNSEKRSTKAVPLMYRQ